MPSLLFPLSKTVSRILFQEKHSLFRLTVVIVMISAWHTAISQGAVKTAVAGAAFGKRSLLDFLGGQSTMTRKDLEGPLQQLQDRKVVREVFRRLKQIMDRLR